MQQSLPLVYFSLGWLAAIYLFTSAVTGRFKKIDLGAALLYTTSVAVVGVFGEVLVDSLYQFVFGVPLWQYRVLPIHNAYTSYYSPVIWGMYGFYLYLMHDSLCEYCAQSIRPFAVFIALEAIMLELVLNFSHLATFNQYIFYYLPNGLWHLSAFQVIPFYFIAGLVIAGFARGCKSSPRFFIFTNLVLLSVLVFLTR